ncbi:MAG: hypothetical protein ACREHG_10305 [Candidatus Saccharimonadales bacterium]
MRQTAIPARLSLIATNLIGLLVATYFAMTGQLMPSQLVSIAQCESHLQQFHTDGTLILNTQGSGAMGVFQELPFHKKVAANMGWDITTAEGNIAYGIWLYQKYGSAPWDASKGCWGPELATETALPVAERSVYTGQGGSPASGGRAELELLSAPLPLGGADTTTPVTVVERVAIGGIERHDTLFVFLERRRLGTSTSKTVGG